MLVDLFKVYITGYIETPYKPDFEQEVIGFKAISETGERFTFTKEDGILDKIVYTEATYHTPEYLGKELIFQRKGHGNFDGKWDAGKLIFIGETNNYIASYVRCV